MQGIKFISQWLTQNANDKHYLFRSDDLRSLVPDLSDLAFKTLLSRVVGTGILLRLCRGLYLYEKTLPKDGLLLFHAAELLRANAFNYISLETVLSDAGIISQIPINWISIMSSGRSNKIVCGEFGTIEYIHTNQKPTELINELSYDQRCGMWRASIKLALRDMKATHRASDLIDWDIANELI
jgi:predicted transcriptional regulator of viral defense system